MTAPAENPLRIALVTQRFWPLLDGVETVIANLAEELRRQGHTATIVTPQWDKHWPRELVHRETPVVRLAPSPTSGFGTLRYMYSLSRWLQKHADRLDAVLVSLLRQDAYSAVGTLCETPVPIVLRAEGAGASGDCQWHRHAPFGLRIRQRCQLADGCIATSDVAALELREAGFAAERITRIDNGVSLPPLRSPDRREAARTALVEANHDLSAVESGPVVVYLGRLHPEKGLLDLINAWPTVRARHAGARLWLVGDGPQRVELFDRIGDLGLKYQICLPGAFDDVEELLQAADLFVQPAYETRTSLALLQSLAAGLPVIASDTAAHRRLVEHEATGLLYPARDVRALAAALLRGIEQSAESVQLGAQARRQIEQRFSLERMAAEHVELLARLRQQKSAARAELP